MGFADLSALASRRSIIAGAGAAMMATLAHSSEVRSPAKLDGDAIPTGPGLAELGSRTDLPVGVFASDGSFNDAAYLAAIQRNCDLFAPMNELKRRVVEPVPGKYDFPRAEKMVAWASRARMRVHGHTLVWHKGDPKWVAPLLAKSSDERLITDHVTYVMSRFRGRIGSWDVVNEAIQPTDGRSDGLRNSIWLQAFGEHYIDLAFQAARKADPAATLLLTDYGLETDHPVSQARRKAMLELLERLLKRGVPIDGVGFQAHFRRYGYPFNAKIFRPFLDRIRDLGLKFSVNEFDVADWNGPLDQEQRDLDVADLTARFADLVLSYPQLQWFMCFGLSDRYTWLNAERPTLWLPKSRCLPLDDTLAQKPMYTALADALKTRRVRTLSG
ncbi:1,4-beta-xylanase [Sphingobium amiense]|uniref:Beta-xylanase n=1 Tax=Sphingobium amiense TaxID=135719 RepID=A0A494W981_9SPHN|nr:1,4-beta-xylanase [Sphingobium amiense]